MINNHETKFSTALVIKKMQIKITIRFNFILIEMTIKQIEATADEDDKKWKLLYIVCENIKMTYIFWKVIYLLLKIITAELQ